MLAVFVEEQNVGFAYGLADQISSGRGLQDGVDFVRIGNHHLARLAWQLDDHRLVQAEHDLTPRLTDTQIGVILLLRQSGRGHDDAPKRKTSSSKRD